MIDLVEDGRLERRLDVALLLVDADMQVRMVSEPIACLWIRQG
jgi:hypothetical protein